MNVKLMSVDLNNRDIYSEEDSKKIKINDKQFYSIIDKSMSLPKSAPWEKMENKDFVKKSVMPSVTSPESIEKEYIKPESQAYEKRVVSFDVPKKSINDNPKYSVPDFVPSIKKDDDPNSILRKVNTIEKLSKETAGNNVMKLLSTSVSILGVLKDRLEKIDEKIKSLTESSRKNEDLKNSKLRDAKTIEAKISSFPTSYDEISSSVVTNSPDEFNKVNDNLSEISRLYKSTIQIVSYIKDSAAAYADAKDKDDSSISDLESEKKNIFSKMNAVCEATNKKYNTAKEADDAKKKTDELAEERARKIEEAKKIEARLSETVDFDVKSLGDVAGINDIISKTKKNYFDDLRNDYNNDNIFKDDDRFGGRSA